ncbi:hypothetical protein H6G45_01110 [Synechocystis sp. FACHB-383]|uniref:hypothetical protein n=1 Tax=Synechocystis sp. FACHB-383 TaxID=2692864 RepID=UPI00168658AB|nr:hypothetical protein [Synechocystis sp. FACHB-383]MBD2652109.1 hypothetical protein [Synechocystis sp. FACHB-383]
MTHGKLGDRIANMFIVLPPLRILTWVGPGERAQKAATAQNHGTEKLCLGAAANEFNSLFDTF